ncbi:endo-1,4-beta-xylanase [Paucibacter sp. M5-1]|uniref:endo-1,4-beta-xylanase n=1 Tax=Paucibacter sp. M5-1 TaxID=3015998 RepID=UPI0022B8F82B|nr:endo-1,4-beta-xylanase [Paucibacter sp. M5-1]MCZ7883016.1 endo-1,4-beta-xylanase [Paucibacter sp. M5-1]
MPLKWRELARILPLTMALCASLALAKPPLRPISPELQSKQAPSLLGAQGMEGFVLRDSEGIGATFRATDQHQGHTVYTINVPKRSRSANAVEVLWNTDRPIAKGDVGLVRVYARTLRARQESAEAEMKVMFQRNSSPWEKSFTTLYSFGPDWTLIEIPFTASTSLEAGRAALHLGFGGLEQSVELAGLELLNFGNRATLSELPSTRYTYPGREDGAAWRAEALQRIEAIRTAPISITVVDKSGQPVRNARIEAALVQPKFLWGTEVHGGVLLQQTPEAERYRSELLANFDTAVPGNQLKWPGWIKDRTVGIRAVDWLNANGLRVRGHNVVWPGWQFTPEQIKSNPQRATELAGQIDAHLRDIVSSMRGKVMAWDVVNEPMHEKDYFAYMPREESLANWYKAVRAIDPDAQLALNDYAMLNSSASPLVIGEFVDLIGKVRQLGGPIDVIGVQGHVGQQPRAPELVLKDLDLFRPTGLPVQITEFDINTSDEQLQADYTRDFLIAIYSHPVVNGYIQWGFYEGHHWKPKAAMFRKDWSEKPNLQVWRDLVLKQWKTRFASSTDSAGALHSRGHFGKYKLTVSAAGKRSEHEFQHDSSGAPVRIVLP